MRCHEVVRWTAQAERRKMDTFGNAAVQERSLGDMLVEASVISDDQLRHALTLCEKDGREFQHVLVELGLVTRQQLAMLKSFQLKIPYVNVRIQPVDGRALDLVPESIARKYEVMPLRIVDGAILVAMENPEDVEVVGELACLTGRRVQPAVGIPEDIRDAIDQNYQADTWLFAG